MTRLKAMALATILCGGFSVSASAEVYQPGMQGNGLNELEETLVQHGMFGAGFASTLTSNNDHQPSMVFSGRYFAGEKWYLLGELQLGTFSSSAVEVDGEELRAESEEALRYTFGAGYSLLQGTASTSGIRAVPWVLATEFNVGEQTSGDTSGRYTSLGVSVQFQGERIWTALGFREFLISDERLEQLGSDRGMQWDISLGMWF